LRIGNNEWPGALRCPNGKAVPILVPCRSLAKAAASNVSLPRVAMPNKDGFIADSRPELELNGEA
jgi:hypothetical protein